MTITRTGLMPLRSHSQCGLSTCQRRGVSAREAAKLGKELTCVGARLGQATDTIRRTGKLSGRSAGMAACERMGDHQLTLTPPKNRCSHHGAEHEPVRSADRRQKSAAEETPPLTK